MFQIVENICPRVSPEKYRLFIFFSLKDAPLIFLIRMHNFHALLRFLTFVLCFLSLESVPALVRARPNPITSTTRLWAEWDVVPNTQWAPRSIDPSATQDRSLQIFKLQPVVPLSIWGGESDLIANTCINRGFLS